jgi:hypothetical protein
LVFGRCATTDVTGSESATWKLVFDPFCRNAATFNNIASD